MATPSAPTVTGAGTGGTVAANTYYCVITLNDGYGETSQSAQTSVVLTGTTSKFTVTAPAAATDKSAWNLYVGTASGGPYWSQGATLVLGTDRVVTTTPPTSGTQAPGTDRSQQTTTQVNIDNSTITTSVTANVITFTGYAPTAADVGNTVRVLGGTNMTAGTLFEIIAFTGTTWTVTGATNLPTSGTTSNMTAKMGGCLATPGRAAQFLIAGNKFHIKSADYVMSASANVAGGKVAVTTSAWYGYGSARFDLGTKPRLLANANSMICLSFDTSSPCLADNIEAGNNGAFTGCTGFSNGGSIRAMFDRCKATSLATGFSIGSLGAARRCYTSACTTGFSVGGHCFACVANLGTTGFAFAANGVTVSHCIATACAGAGFQIDTNGPSALFCVAYGCTGVSGNGFNAGSATGVNLVNCIAEGNSQAGFTVSAWTPAIAIVNCAGYNNTAGNHNLPPAGVEGFLALSGSPFTNAAGNNFSLNSTASAGASCRAAGIPSSFLGLSTTSSPDIGAAQHADLAQPATTDVRNGTVYGGGTGTLVVPAAGNVLTGTTFDNGTAGTATVPTAAQVLLGVTYGASGTALTGTVTLPAAGDVRLSTTYGASLGSTGTLALPAITDVHSGVQYGAGGTEFTGTLAAGVSNYAFM